MVATPRKAHVVIRPAGIAEHDPRRRAFRLPSPRRLVAELIGGPQRRIRSFFSRVLNFRQRRDAGTADYAFWDRARSGKAEGLEISGLLLKPLFSKVAAWTMGVAPRFRLSNPAAQERLNEWWQAHHSEIVQAFEEAVGLGDYYIVVNADLTLTLKPPNVVFPIVNPDNFGEVVGWRIEEQYPHPTEPGRYQTHIDEYRLDGRLHLITNDQGGEVRRQTFRNLLGRLPVIHVPNSRRADELFGRSEADALVALLQLYGEVLEAGAEGNIRQGRPTPVIERLGSAQAVQKFWELYGKKRTHTLIDGTTEIEEYLDFDADKMLTLPGEATFNWKSPPPFIGEVERLLGLLYYLYLEHTELPEWVLGNAITGSRASAETQVEPLVKFIEKKRSVAERWLLELAQVVLGYMGVVSAATRTAEQPTIKWEDLTTKDGQLTLNMVRFAREQGLIDDETTLVLLAALDIEDPQAVLSKARREAEERAERDAEASEERALQDAERRARLADRQASDEEEAQTEPEAQVARAVA